MEILLRFLGILLKIARIFQKVFVILLSGTRKQVPAIDNDLFKLSGTRLAELIRTKQITSSEVIKLYINRVKDVNPILNAVVEDRFEAAIEEAKLADNMVQQLDVDLIKDKYPLLGVPITVKETCPVNDCSFTAGCYQRKGIKATQDCVPVANLRIAGAIPILVSNTPEFCTSWETFNYITGRTRNPYNTRCTPGGSSGGEAALLGAGASIIGIGSDLAGSIRIPSSHAGIFGHKPTGGLVDVKEHFPYSSDEVFLQYLCIGPMCRYAEDLSLTLKAMVPEKVHMLRLDDEIPIEQINIYYKLSCGLNWCLNLQVESEIKVKIYKCLEYFRGVHCNVREFPIRSLHTTLEDGLVMFFQIKDIPSILRDPKDPTKSDSLVLELIKCCFGCSKYTYAALYFCILIATKGCVPASRFPYNIQKTEKLKSMFINMLGESGVFIYPTYPTSAPRHRESYVSLVGVIYTMIFNVLGFPATHIPLGLNKDGMPIGVQVIAAPNQDRLCLRVSRELEKVFGGWVPPP